MRASKAVPLIVLASALVAIVAARWKENPTRTHIEQSSAAASASSPNRVEHTHASGVVPLELVQTPQGTISIQRTFASDGKLLREEAFLDGKPVPVPSPRS